VTRAAKRISYEEFFLGLLHAAVVGGLILK